jgi:OOP family OmpA-OmpF porin
MNHLYLLFVLAISPLFVIGQRVNAYNWEGGLLLGTAHYTGDLTPELMPNLKDIRPSVGIIGRVPLGYKTAFRSGFIFSRVVGEGSNSPLTSLKGYNFQSDIFEMSLLLEFEPFAQDKFYSDSKGNLNLDKLLSPYIFAGGAFSIVRVDSDFSQVQDVNNEPSIREDLRQSPTRTIPVIPIGAGIKLDLSVDLGIALEASGRFTFSDYIDGVSQSANPLRDDSYLMINFCLFKRF